MNMEDIDGEHDGVVRLLISKGANINSLSHNNSTPLHDAAYFGRVGSVEILLEAGASVNARNDKYQTPRDLAKKKKSPAHYRILEMLDEHAAKTNVGVANLREGDSQIDFTKFMELSNRGLVVIDFYAAWCPHCVDFEEYWSRLASLHPEVTFCRLICAGASPDLRTEAHAVASQYGIRSYPTFWLVQNEERLAEVSGGGERGYRRLNEMIESTVEGKRSQRGPPDGIRRPGRQAGVDYDDPSTDFIRALQARGMMGRGGPLMF
jgi:thiol-disulfide isomerase/thioredoxin